MKKASSSNTTHPYNPISSTFVSLGNTNADANPSVHITFEYYPNKHWYITINRMLKGDTKKYPVVYGSVAWEPDKTYIYS